MRIVLLIAGLIIGSVLAFGQFGGNAVEVSPDHPAIEYESRPVRDRIAELNRRIRENQVQLIFRLTATSLPS